MFAHQGVAGIHDSHRRSEIDATIYVALCNLEMYT